MLRNTNENITMNEVENDGRTIHLYFNGVVGLYAAYGLSAFILSQLTEVKPSFSDDMQMPVVVINHARYELLKEKLIVVREARNYRCLWVEEPIDEQAYDEWVDVIRSDRNK